MSALNESINLSDVTNDDEGDLEKAKCSLHKIAFNENKVKENRRRTKIFGKCFESPIYFSIRN